jgi:organic hydroperoxide reductase OsmC/OhrA
MNAPFPHRYQVQLHGFGVEAATLTAGTRVPITAGAPAEFDGSDAWWSPEHLLLSSLGLCLMTTFQGIARKAKLDVRDYVSDAEAVLDKTPGGLGFTSLVLHVQVAVAADQAERARQLINTAKHYCIVANALMPPVHLKVTVVPTDATLPVELSGLVDVAGH